MSSESIRKAIEQMKKYKHPRLTTCFHSLRVQLILVFTLISVIVITMSYYIGYAYSINILKKYNEKYMLDQFSQSAYNIQNVMAEVDRLSMLFVLDGNVQDFLQQNYGSTKFEVVQNQKNILNLITKYIENYSYLDSVYLLTDNGGKLGCSETRSVTGQNGKNDAVYRSDLFVQAKAENPRFFWGGGNTTLFFNPDSDSNEDKHLITAAKLVKPNYEPNLSATLVVNIDESYLQSLYSSMDFSNQFTYIIDSKGKIISSENTEKIGTSSSTITRANLKSDYGSITTQNGLQVVYYKIGSTGWYLVCEIPLSSFNKDVFGLQKNMVTLFCASILIIFVITYLLLKKVINPLYFLAEKMSEIGDGNLGITIPKIPKNELGIVIKRFNEMSLNIKELITKNKEMQEEKRRLEVESLQTQINPHFIYNTLNMIRWMGAMINAPNIVNSVIALGNLLRPTFNSADPTCSIGAEIEYLRNYLKIVNLRFGDMISFSLKIPEELKSCQIPRFILQPIIENVVSHAVGGKNHADIGLTIQDEGSDLTILISDNGVGIPRRELDEINHRLDCAAAGPFPKNSGIGLFNVARRIYLNFGKNYGLHIESTEGVGTRVTVRIPAVQSGDAWQPPSITST